MSNKTTTAADAAKVALHRRRIRQDFGTWCEYELAKRGQTPAKHHRLLIDELSKVANGETQRLMIMMPPGSAKSEYVSRLFPVWYLAYKPRGQVIAASHTISLATAFGRKVRNTCTENSKELGYDLVEDNKSVGGFATNLGGEYYAAGVGTALPGRRAQLFLIDDPVAGREAAESPVDRDRVWNWYLSDALTRGADHAMSIVLCMTRFHEDDLAGRLLESEGDKWRVITLPAQAEDDDLLGREPGEFLWPESNYAQTCKERLEQYGEDRDWVSLFQQRPAPQSGALFKIANIKTISPPAVPASGVIVRAWDLASTAKTGTKNPDWSVGVKLMRTSSNEFIILDVIRFRGEPSEVEAAIVNVAQQDGTGVKISLPQDPGQAGKSQISYLTKALMGFNVHSSPESGKKDVRAMPVISQCNAGNISMVQAHWNATLITELANFPGSRFDDQTDALSRAFGQLIQPAKPARWARIDLFRR